MEEKAQNLTKFLSTNIQIDELIANKKMYSLASYSYEKGWEEASKSKEITKKALKIAIREIKSIHLLTVISSHRKTIERKIERLENQIKSL